MERRLYRSRTDRMIWGVCGGLAKYFELDPTIFRVIFVVLAFINGIGIIAYILMAMIVPLEDSKAAKAKETIRENIEEMKESASELGEELRTTFSGKGGETEERNKRFRRTIFGIVLITLGVIFLLGSFDLFWWFQWRYLWPLVLVAIGLVIILSRRK